MKKQQKHFLKMKLEAGKLQRVSTARVVGVVTIGHQIVMALEPVADVSRSCQSCVAQWLTATFARQFQLLTPQAPSPVWLKTTSKTTWIYEIRTTKMMVDA